MGRKNVSKAGGMNWAAKISLMLIFTMMFSAFMLGGLYQPKGAEAAPTSNGRVTTSINTTTPQSSAYTASTNTFSALSAMQTGVAQTFIVDRAAPTRTEHIAGYVTATGVLYIQRWNGTAWSAEWNVTVGGNGIDGRRFDIAYESSTGNAIVVYSKNVAGANNLAYRTYNGTSWSSETTFTAARLTYAATAMKLAARPGTSQIALAVQDIGSTTANTSSLTTLIWSGSAWGNEPAAAHATNMTNTTTPLVQNDAFDLAYETTAGNLMVVWSQATPQQYYRYFTTGTSTWGTATSFGTARSLPLQMFCVANPASASNQIVIGFNRSGSANIYAFVWSGSAMGSSATVDSTTGNGQTTAIEQKTVTAAWLNNGGTSAAVVLWGSTTANQIDYAYSTNGGTSWTQASWAPTGALAASGKRWMSVDVDPQSLDTLMLTFSELNTTNKLWAKRLQFTSPSTFAWTNADAGVALTTALGSVTSQNFAFAYDRFTGLASLSSPTATAIGTTSATLGATIVSTGATSLTDYGIYWGTTPAPSTNKVQVGTSNFTGAYTTPATGFTQASQVYYRGYATNTNGTAYSGDGSFWALPATQASNVNFTAIGGTAMTVNWTRGSAGSSGGVLVVMKDGSAVTSVPANGTYSTYTANAVFGSGYQFGATGEYIVYKGTGTSAAVTGLISGHTYYVAVYEFAGQANDAAPALGTVYLGSPATGIQATTNNTTALGNGAAGFTSTTVYQGDTDVPVNTFTLATSGGTDTVTSITVSGGATLTTSNVLNAKLWLVTDVNSNGQYDPGTDTLTQVGSTVTTFGSNNAVFSGLSGANVSLTTTPKLYVVTYSIAPTPANGALLTGNVSAFVSSNTPTGTDSSDATLTVNTQKVSVGTPTDGLAGPTSIAVSIPYTNDSDGDSTATVQYGVGASPSSWTTAGTTSHAASPMTFTINGLSPNTIYSVRVQYNDGDGVVGANPVAVAGTLTTASAAPSGVDVLDAWQNVYTAAPGGLSITNQATSPFVVSSGVNRILLANVCVITAATTTFQSVSVTLDNSTGASFTPIGTLSGTAQREQCWMGYLLDAAATPGQHALNVTVTLAGSTMSGIHVKAGSYSGVNQTTPIASFAVNNAAAAAITFGSSVSYTPGDAVVYIAGDRGTGGTSVTQPAAEFSTPSYLNNSNGESTYIGHAFETTSSSYAGTATVTMAGSSSSAIVVATLNSYLPGTVAQPITASDGNGQITVTAPYIGDDTGNNQISVDYCLTSANCQANGGWTNWATSLPHPASPYSPLSISNLTPGTSYDVRVTYTDPDGVTGAGTQGADSTTRYQYATVTVFEYRTFADATNAPATAINGGASNINVTAPYTYDDDHDNTLLVQWRATGPGPWTGTSNTISHSVSPYSYSISGLTPGSCYDVLVTYQDGDGVLGTAAQTISNVCVAENRTIAGTATAAFVDDSTINVSMPYTGDNDGDNAYSVDYCLTSDNCAASGLWTNVVTGATHTASPYTTQITGISTLASYDVRLTYIDADGVTGTNPQIVIARNDITTISAPGNFPIATTAGSPNVAPIIYDTDAGVVMQRIQVTANQFGSQSAVLNSLTIADLSATSVSAAKVYVDSTSSDTALPNTATLVGSKPSWNGGQTSIALDNDSGTTFARTVTNGSPKYIYVTYDMSANQTAAQSSVKAIGVVAPNVGVSGITYNSNPLMLTHKLGSTITSCAGCHGNPPVDAATRDASTGQFPGSHSAPGHNGKDSNNNDITCTTCHVNNTSTGHRSGNIEILSSLNYTKGTLDQTGTYLLVPQSNTFTGGTCSNVAGCHVSSGNPAPSPSWTWGTNDCTQCHNAVLQAPNASAASGGTVTTRRAVAAEFGQTWSHKRSAGGTVTKWDCMACHMEGDNTTGARTATHGNGYVQLRDPDTGNQISQVVWVSSATAGGGWYTSTGLPLSFIRFSRDLTKTLENDPNFLTIAAIQVNLCLNCHDANGAQSAKARVPNTGSASIPFGTPISMPWQTGYGVQYSGTIGWYTGRYTASGTPGGVVNVKDMFAVSNTSYHPVLGRMYDQYAWGSRMAAPWNTGITSKTGTAWGTVAITTSNAPWGYLLSCWDCHTGAAQSGWMTSTVTAHGGPVTLWGTATVGGTASASNGVTLCSKCHNGYYGGAANNHGTGSAFASSTDGGQTPYVNYGCNVCHGSGYYSAGTRGVGVPRPGRSEDMHGSNYLPNWGTVQATSGRWSSTGTPIAFFRDRQMMSNHSPKMVGSTVMSSTCSVSGPSPCNNSCGGYSPSGVY